MTVLYNIFPISIYQNRNVLHPIFLFNTIAHAVYTVLHDLLESTSLVDRQSLQM